jgi:hypothetical protein
MLGQYHCHFLPISFLFFFLSMFHVGLSPVYTLSVPLFVTLAHSPSLSPLSREVVRIRVRVFFVHLCLTFGNSITNVNFSPRKWTLGLDIFVLDRIIIPVHLEPVSHPYHNTHSHIRINIYRY